MFAFKFYYTNLKKLVVLVAGSMLVFAVESQASLKMAPHSVLLSPKSANEIVLVESLASEAKTYKISIKTIKVSSDGELIIVEADKGSPCKAVRFAPRRRTFSPAGKKGSKSSLAFRISKGKLKRFGKGEFRCQISLSEVVVNKFKSTSLDSLVSVEDKDKILQARAEVGFNISFPLNIVTVKKPSKLKLDAVIDTIRVAKGNKQLSFMVGVTGNKHLDGLATLKLGDKILAVTSVLIFNDAAKGKVKYTVDFDKALKTDKNTKLHLKYGKVKKVYSVF